MVQNTLDAFDRFDMFTYQILLFVSLTLSACERQQITFHNLEAKRHNL